jgi:hypothetical protein
MSDSSKRRARAFAERPEVSHMLWYKQGSASWCHVLDTPMILRRVFNAEKCAWREFGGARKAWVLGDRDGGQQ